MQVSRSHRGILVPGDALEHVQVDARVGHPGERGVPQPVADQAGEAEVPDEGVPARGVAEGGCGDDATARSQDQAFMLASPQAQPLESRA